MNKVENNVEVKNDAKVEDNAQDSLNLTVRNIIGDPKDGISRVTVNSEVFQAVIDSIRARFNNTKPVLEFKGMGDKAGNGMRVFNINGVELYVHYHDESRKMFLFMKTEEAKARLVSLAEERANEPKLPFNVEEFDLSVVASV